MAQLMARLGRLLERHGPDGVVVMSREEYEREQAATYAAGWQDAAEEYEPRIAAARWEGWLGRWRPLRAVEGSGEVVGFPRVRRPGRRFESPPGRRLPAQEPHGPLRAADAPEDAVE
jgi:hypothetical protein